MGYVSKRYESSCPVSTGEEILVDLGLLFSARRNEVSPTDHHRLRIGRDLAVLMRNSSGVEQFYLVDETVGKELIDKLHCPCRLVVDDIYMGEEGMEYAVLYRPETLFGEHEDMNTFEMDMEDVADCLINE